MASAVRLCDGAFTLAVNDILDAVEFEQTRQPGGVQFVIFHSQRMLTGEFGFGRCGHGGLLWCGGQPGQGDGEVAASPERAFDGDAAAVQDSEARRQPQPADVDKSVRFNIEPLDHVINIFGEQAIVNVVGHCRCALHLQFENALAQLGAFWGAPLERNRLRMKKAPPSSSAACCTSREDRALITAAAAQSR